VPYTDAMIDNAAADALNQATPDGAGATGVSERYGAATTLRAFDGDPGRLTEMDALVAYLQILGRLTDAAKTQTAATETTP
jgi:cytochrome c oxidase cbb3-type subunit 2